MTDHGELRRLAEAAPHQRLVHGEGDCACKLYDTEHPEYDEIARCWWQFDKSHEDQAAFFAAASPATVLALLDEADRLRGALTKIRDTAKSWEGRDKAPYWNLGDIAAGALLRGEG
jgi:hypothetical protein